MNRHLLILVCGIALLVGCEKPQVTSLGTPVTVGGVTFTVNDYDIQIMEVSEGDKTFGYARPVMVVPVEIKNDGPDSFVYAPTHKTQQMGEATTPLLYADPGPEADLPPESKNPINGVYLEKGAPSEQLNSPQTIDAGASITDLFLFEVPPDSTSSLIFSIPPSMHRKKLPVLVRIPYTAKEPKGPKIHEMRAPISFEKVSLTVDSAKFEYVKTVDTAQGKGHSTEVLLKVAYTIENKSEEGVLYDPGHNVDGGLGLFGKRSTFKRVKFGPNTTPVGQIVGQKKLTTEDSVTDFALFEVSPDTLEATLEFPARLFARKGVARVNIKIDPEQPKNPTKKKGAKKTEPVEKKEGVVKDG